MSSAEAKTKAQNDTRARRARKQPPSHSAECAVRDRQVLLPRCARIAPHSQKIHPPNRLRPRYSARDYPHLAGSPARAPRAAFAQRSPRNRIISLNRSKNQIAFQSAVTVRHMVSARVRTASRLHVRFCGVARAFYSRAPRRSRFLSHNARSQMESLANNRVRSPFVL